MKNILTIFKKEWDRVIKDKRLVLTVMLMPGLMIFLIYTFIGTALQNTMNQDIYQVAIVNPQLEFKNIYDQDANSDTFYVIAIDSTQVAEYETDIDNANWDLLIQFADNIDTYDGTGTKPDVQIYYNPNEIASTTIYGTFANYLMVYRSTLSYDLYGDTTYFNYVQNGTPLDQNGIAGTMMASLLPMLIIMFLFSGAMAIGPESIAGEKERGTIATLLVTPVKRREIAIGKIFALSVLTLISATSSFIGIIASLPKLLQSTSNIDISMYTVWDFSQILLILFSTVFVIVGVISIISAYAKSLKEASSMIVPIYILTILVSISSMFGNGANTNFYMYLLPIYNSVQALTAIFTFDTNALTYLLITIGANLVYLTFFVIILNRMFNSEKIMFNK
ncbi:MAG: ABC transporter permease [Bacilli bacterium]|nr:ABC transporter permease [Bacilli bacterium]MBN2877370.1 ABC transporter permease [Bacilli bacterium]